MNPLLLAIVVLAAILVGVTIPVLLQLRATLRSVQVTIDELRPQIQTTLTEVEHAAKRLNRVSGRLEESVSQAQSLVGSVANLGRQVGLIGSSVRTAASVGSAFGPALAAAFRAFIGRRDRNDEPPAPEDDPAVVPSKATTETDSKEVRT